MKKTIFTVFFALLIFGVVAQSQISELQKGLIFRWEGSSWNPYRDMVSGTLGTATDTYNVLGKGGEGRRELVYNGTSSYTTLPTIPAFGTGDFTVILKIKVKTLASLQFILGGGVDMFAMAVFTDGRLGVIDIGVEGTLYSTTTLAIDTWYQIVYKRTSAVGTFVINTTTDPTVSDVFNYTSATTVFGSYISSYFFSGSISMCRIFNYALSTDDIAYYSKPENPIKATHIGSGATKNVLNLNAEGLAQSTSGYWYDKTNSLTATNSGTNLVIPPASNLKSTYFNGTTGKVVYTGMNGLTGITTISAQIQPLALGGYIFDNTKVRLKVNSSGYLSFSRDGSTFINSAAASIAINTAYNILVTSTAAGVTNFYINGVLSGTANQAAGTPASGTTWNIGTDATTFYTGNIANLSINGEILDLDRIKLINDTNF